MKHDDIHTATTDVESPASQRSPEPDRDVMSWILRLVGGHV